MKYDFDEIIERRGTNSAKWDFGPALFGNPEALPMWVADTDFRIPPAVQKALADRVGHGVFGYTLKDDGYGQSVTGWLKRRHGWVVDPEHLAYSPGVLAGISVCLEAFSDTGDGILVQPPTYQPFVHLIRDNRRTLVESPLRLAGDRYEMDFKDLENKLSDPAVKVMILCSPHNPVGRVWTLEELTRLGDLCLRHRVVVVSDEIHCDLVLKNHRHIPFASVSDAFAANSATLMSASKTFNIADLHHAVAVLPDMEKRTTYENILQARRISMMSSLGIEATRAAYDHGAEYLEALLDYIGENLGLLREFITARVPLIKVIPPEATYLVWLDFRELGLDHEALLLFLVNKARVALEPGQWFGPTGRGFMRVNIGCPRAVLQDALTRIERAVNTGR